MAPLDTASPLILAGLPLEAIMPGLEALQPGQAVAAYWAWLAANPASPQRFAAWFNLGALLGGSGDRASAMIAYRQALALKPDLHQATVNLGLTLEAEERAALAGNAWLRSLGDTAGFASRMEAAYDRIRLRPQGGAT